MTVPRHHPDEDVLLAYGVGTLGPGAALTVETHVERCAACARTLRFLERVGGALIESEGPQPLADGALDSALARLGRVRSRPVRSGVKAGAMPATIEDHHVGRWLWLSPGLRVAALRGAGGPGECVFLMRARGGAKIPRHGHDGTEHFTVLAGAVAVDAEVFGPGDYGETECGREHALTIAPGGECLCLFSIDGPLVFHGVARWWMRLWGGANNVSMDPSRG